MKLIYARQSIEKKDSISIEAQIEKCIALCTYNGWDYKVFKDSGYSGKNLKRPGFISMMSELKTGKCDGIICYRLDRISRSIADFSNLIVDLERYGVKFMSTTENFDTSTPLGRAMVNIIMIFAQLERETTVDRVTDNYYTRTKLGHWGGGPAPYGYELQKVVGVDGKKYTTLKVNEYESEIVRNIYKLYLEPEGSVSSVINKLNESGVPSRGGSAGAAVWTSRVVSEILWRPIYAPNDMKIYNYFRGLSANIVHDVDDFDGTKAVNLYGKINKSGSKHKRCRPVSNQYFIISPHQSIIDSDTWLRVQAKKIEKKSSPPRLGTGQNSVFTGIMKCGVCGYSVSSSGDGKGYKNYICSSRKNRGKDICSLPLISHRNANAIIFEDMVAHLSSDEVRNDIYSAKNNRGVSSEYLNKKNALEIEIIKNETEIDNLLTSIAEGNSVVIRYVNEKIAALDNHKKMLLSDLNDLEMNEYSSNNKYDNIDTMIELLDNMDDILKSENFDSIKRLCHTFISSITFHADKSIDIEYYV
jgi:Site-specific recombinases, DNA invertase Pin homologs